MRLNARVQLAESTFGSTQDTRDRLLQAAYELLAEHGLQGFKVVEVASRANANVALINYHFGGRDGLLDEVIHNQFAVRIAGARDRLLDELLEASAGKQPDAEAVVRCWLGPWVEASRATDRQVTMLLLHVMFAQDVDTERKERLLGSGLDVTRRYIDVLAKCYPQVPRVRLTWRMLCVIGAGYMILGQREPVGWQRLSDASGPRPTARLDDALEELVAFILGGLAAPEPGPLAKTKVRPAQTNRKAKAPTTRKR